MRGLLDIRIIELKIGCFISFFIFRGELKNISDNYHMRGGSARGRGHFLSMASILSNVPEILHVQHQVFWSFQREKYTFFQKCSKIGLVAKKLIIPFFLGGGSEPKVVKITFFEPFP